MQMRIGVRVYILTVSVAEETTPQSQINRKLEASIFYWVAGGCIGALILAGVIGLTIAFTYRARNKRRKPGLKVDRVDQNGNVMSNGRKPIQVSR
mgnify:FL=1